MTVPSSAAQPREPPRNRALTARVQPVCPPAILDSHSTKTWVKVWGAKRNEEKKEEKS